MRQFILSLLACLCLTAYSQTTSQADLLVEEAQKLESKQDYPTAITKLKQADELYVKTGKTQSAERATCLHILGRCYLNLERPEGLTYTQMAADMRKTILGETNIKYISSLNNTGLYYLTVAKDYPKAAEIHGKTWELCSRIQPRPEQAFMFHINLARCYIALGEMDKASAIVEEEIAISKKMYGEKSLSVARQLQQIGSLYYLSGRKDVGVTYYEQAFNIFPDDSKEYEQLLDWISSIYLELNNQPKALEYMKLTYKHLKSKGSRAKLILGGWGGGHQLPSLLKGLDRALPQDIIFSCLNPDLGKSPQPDFLEEIARNRSVWAVPWLEGDHQLWHFQPRVNMMREQVKLAAEQNLDGVIAIHWRTEEPRFNFRTFARFASDKGADESVDQLYDRYLTEEFGEEAAKEMTPLLARMDREQIQWNVPSPEFYAYTPEWGLLDENNVRIRQELVSSGESLLKKLRGEKRENLKRFIAMFRFELLLGEVDRAMMPAFILKKKEVQGEKINGSQEYMDAYRLLVSAPVKEMFDTYMERVHSRGELGVLSSLNQRVWREYNDLKIYLENKIKEK